MNFIDSLSHFKTKKIHPDKWASYFAWISIFIFIIIGIVFLPIILLIVLNKPIYLLLIPFVSIPAFLIGKHLYSTLKKRIVFINEFTTYVLYPDEIQFEKSNYMKRLPKETNIIPFKKIDFCIVSHHYRDSLNFYSDAFRRKQTKTGSSFPIIKLFYHSNEDRFYKNIFFDENKEDTINTWLQKFKFEYIPLYFTPDLEKNTSVEQHFSYLKNKSGLLAFTFEVSWLLQEEKLNLQYEKLEISKEFITVAPLTQSQKDSNATYKLGDSSPLPTNKETNKTKFSNYKPKKVWKVDLFNLFYIFILISTLVLFEKLNLYVVSNSLEGFPLLFALSFFYFNSMGEQLRWTHMIRFPIVSGVFSFCLAVVFLMFDSQAGNSGINFAANSFFIIWLIWIPYLLIKLLNKRKKKHLKQ